MNTLSATLIVKDDRHVLVTIAQLRPYVAEIVVGFTPPEDGALLESELRAAGADVVVDVPRPLRDWSSARNRVHEAATQPFVMWADSDDEVDGLARLPEALALLESNPLGRLLCPYDYAIDPKTGAVLSRQWRERVVRNDGRFTWRYPCHEVLIAKDGQYGEREPRAPFLVWKHAGARHDAGQLPMQAEMLRAWLAEHPDDPWGHHNLARTLLRTGQPREAAEHFERYLAASGWDDEKCLAMLELGRAEQMAAGFGGDDAKAMAWIERARALRPAWFEPHYEMGKAWELRARLRGDAHGLERAAECYGCAREAIPTTDHPFESKPLDREFRVHDCERQAREEMQEWRGALGATRRALKAGIDTERLRTLARKYEAAIALETASAATAVDASLDVLFACGISYEEWNPAALEHKGLGGSETAVIEMAKRLRQRGCRVRVYGNVGGDGIYDGVVYRDARGVKDGDRIDCDVLVAWRMAPLLDLAEARVGRLLWCHDVTAANWTARRGLQADRVLALSEWHKGNLVKEHRLDPERVHVTRNGVDLARFDPYAVISLCSECHGGRTELTLGLPHPNCQRCGKATPGQRGHWVRAGGWRDPHKAIYSSSADRGLQVLLDLWPEIRERVPDATLEVCYGMDLWKAIADSSGSQQQRYTVHSLERRLRTTPGVTYHGRVDQKRLATMMMAAGVYPYPGHFDETSMIGGMEATAAGLRFVGSARAALNETIGPRGVLLDGDWLDERYQRDFVDEVVRAMTATEGEWVIGREALMAYAQDHFGWDAVADSWVALFETLRQEAAVGTMPAYGGKRA